MIQRKLLDSGLYEAGNSAPVNVEIFLSEVSALARNVENIKLYGFANNQTGSVIGYSLSCTVHWRTADYALDPDDEDAWRYFKKLIRQHLGSRDFASEAVLDMTFTDPEFDEPVGVGMGHICFHCSPAN